jgi:hypothetical protein
VVPRPATVTKDDLANELPKEKKDKSVVSAAKKAAKTPLPRKMDTKRSIQMKMKCWKTSQKTTKKVEMIEKQAQKEGTSLIISLIELDSTMQLEQSYIKSSLIFINLLLFFNIISEADFGFTAVLTSNRIHPFMDQTGYCTGSIVFE